MLLLLLWTLAVSVWLGGCEVDDFYDDYDGDSSNIHSMMIESPRERCNDLSFDWEFVAWRRCPGCSRRSSVCAAGDMIGLDGKFLGGYRCLRVPPECLPYLKVRDKEPPPPRMTPSTASGGRIPASSFPAPRPELRPRPRPRPEQRPEPALPFPVATDPPSTRAPRPSPRPSPALPTDLTPRCRFVKNIPPRANRNTCGSRPRPPWKVYKGRCLRSRKPTANFCPTNLKMMAAFGQFPTRKHCQRDCPSQARPSTRGPSSRAGLSRQSSVAKRNTCTMRKARRCAVRYQARKPKTSSEGCLGGSAKKGRRVMFHFQRTGGGDGLCRPSYYYGCRPDGSPFSSLRAVLRSRKFNLFPSKKSCSAFCCQSSSVPKL